MKRRLEITSQNTSKKHKFLPALPNEVWKFIVSFLDYSDYQTRGSLRSVSSFFAKDTEISASYFQDVIRTNFLDYVHHNELISYMPQPCTLDSLTFDVATFKKLLVTFYAQLEKERIKLNESYKVNESESDTDFEYDIEDFTYCLRNIMYSASKSGHIAILKLLIDSEYCDIEDFINYKELGTGGEDKMTALGYAAAFGRKQIFSLLLQNGAQFTVGEIVPWDCQHLIMFDLGYYFKTPLTPLHIIGLRSDENWLLNILEDFSHLLGSVLTDNFKKCLEMICQNNPEQLLTLLDTDELLLEAKDVAGWRLLHWASCLDRTECMKVLIQKGVDVEGGNISALYLACSAGKLSAIKILIANRALVEPYINDNTCLHLTANNGHKECTKYLIEECKLDVNEENDDRETPLTLALLNVDSDNMELSPLVKAKKAECAELLRSLGAKNNPHARIL